MPFRLRSNCFSALPDWCLILPPLSEANLVLTVCHIRCGRRRPSGQSAEAILNTAHRGSVGVITDTLISGFGTCVGKDLHIHAETFYVCKGDPPQAHTFSQINRAF